MLVINDCLECSMPTLVNCQKDIILQSLLHPGGVRVVFATMALGMGGNMQNVNTIIQCK